MCHSRGKKDSALSSSMYNIYQKSRRENKQKVNKIDPKCISGGRSGSASGEVGGVLGLPGRGCNMPAPNWTHCRCIFGASSEILRAFGSVLGGFKGIFALSWSVLGESWEDRGASRGCLGRALGFFLTS